MASGPVVERGGALAIASVTSWGRIGGISGVRWECNLMGELAW